MRHRFDQLGKRIGREALGPSGPTAVHDEISPDAQHADLRHEPDPACAAERARLGLLGRIAAVLCLIEIYAHAPDGSEFRACLRKHLAFWQQRDRRANPRTKERAPRAFAEPFLWIITAGVPTAILAKLELTAAPDWPPGVYFFGEDVLRVGLVVASELPRDRSTLLVRLMAAGPLLSDAIEDLSALPAGAHERTVADQILLRLSHVLGAKPKRTPEEQEFIVRMFDTWEKAREQGHTQGRKEARAGDLLTVLRVRGIVIPEAARERILAERDLDRLGRWFERALLATSLADVLDDAP
jgi:hypothetical protein